MHGHVGADDLGPAIHHPDRGRGQLPAPIGDHSVDGGAEQLGVPVGIHPADHRLAGFDPDFTIEEGDEFTVGSVTLKAMHTPGHSKGSVTFATPEGLISGDVLFRDSIGRTDLPGGDFDTLVRTIREKLFVHPADTTVYPGHGPVTTIGHEMESNPFVGARALKQA